MEERVKNLRLREWLIAQIDSGQYTGLRWENEDKSMFRIPWKHAAKQDYKQNEDAALFKAWAVYKGKYREGRDKADPTMWKTRLRCALNKSTDFQEVPECSQLDLSEPYKVYCIKTEMDSDKGPEAPQTESQVIIHANWSGVPQRNPEPLQPQFVPQRESEVGNVPENPSDGVAREHMYHSSHGGTPRSPATAPAFFLSSALTISDVRLQVRLFYHGRLVLDLTTSSADGVFILQGPVPLGSERIYGPCSAQQVYFPVPASLRLDHGIAQAMDRLLPHLKRGVLLWVAPDGLFIKRFCQGRVYWSGPLALNADRPNKLERERTCKLLDTSTFLRELQDYHQGEGASPRYEVDLCFGEEFPDPSLPETTKLIMARVVPLFAVDLLQRFQTEEKQHLHTLGPPQPPQPSAEQL